MKKLTDKELVEKLGLARQTLDKYYGLLQESCESAMAHFNENTQKTQLITILTTKEIANKDLNVVRQWLGECCNVKAMKLTKDKDKNWKLFVEFTEGEEFTEPTMSLRDFAKKQRDSETKEFDDELAYKQMVALYRKCQREGVDFEALKKRLNNEKASL